jgi:hypothetical protein
MTKTAVLGCLLLAGCSTTATYVHPDTGRVRTCERNGIAATLEPVGLVFDSFKRYSTCKDLSESLGYVRQEQP